MFGANGLEAEDAFAIGVPELFAAGHRRVRERKMMRAGFARDGYSALFGGAQQLDATRRAEMLAMHARAGQFGQQNVPGDDHFLARRRPTAQAQRHAPIAFVNHAIGNQRVILAMVHDWEIEHPRVFERAPHQVVVLHAMPVIGDRHHAG